MPQVMGFASYHLLSGFTSYSSGFFNGTSIEVDVVDMRQNIVKFFHKYVLWR